MSVFGLSSTTVLVNRLNLPGCSRWPLSGYSLLLRYTTALNVQESNKKGKCRQWREHKTDWGVEGLHCISTGESITQLEVQWWGSWVQWVRSSGSLWIMAENVNSGWQIHVMSGADSLYMCLKGRSCVAESDGEPLFWHQWHDWHTEEQ